ncbi:MAG: ATP-binding cassette domain-containing protein [Candidatus Dadabacteria bacterium]|nr:MAG: ATP-binding cassette domain-containing protein [Candidatus Dadabacteria bacterium]
MTAVDIDLRNVEIGFGGPPVLHEFNLSVPSSQTLVVLGESGSGKSTMLGAILGLIRPQRGEVEVFGERVDALSERQLHPVRARIGMVFQYGALFDSETVAENVGFRIRQQPRFDAARFEREVQEKLEFVGLAEFRDRLPGELSGGQKKRVAIARALVGDPALMLYDEPTTGLDPITARKVLEVIRRIREEFGTTSIVVTHELHYAYYIADRVILIRNGRVVFDGTPEAFRAADDPYIVEFRSMEAE